MSTRHADVTPLCPGAIALNGDPYRLIAFGYADGEVLVSVQRRLGSECECLALGAGQGFPAALRALADDIEKKVTR